MSINRWFYRCTGCLEVVALNEPLRMEFSVSHATCTTCDQHLELMGRVKDNRLFSDKIECKCDDRCTSARGPLCACKCGGENHGSGLMGGYHTVTTDKGPAPRVTMPDTKGREKARAQWQEYHVLRSELIDILNRYSDRRRAGEFLPRGDFDRMRDLQYASRKAHEARSHAGRIKALRTVLPIVDAA